MFCIPASSAIQPEVILLKNYQYSLFQCQHLSGTSYVLSVVLNYFLQINFFNPPDNDTERIFYPPFTETEAQRIRGHAQDHSVTMWESCAPTPQSDPSGHTTRPSLRLCSLGSHNLLPTLVRECQLNTQHPASNLYLAFPITRECQQQEHTRKRKQILSSLYEAT